MNQFHTAITLKGQVTIPSSMREVLGLSQYDRVFVELQKDYIKISPAEDILDLAGHFKSKANKKLMKSRDKITKNYKRF